jgi:hypothetical protein
MRFDEQIIEIKKDSLLKRSMVDPSFVEKILNNSIDFEDHVKITQGKFIDIQRQKIQEPNSFKKAESLLISSISWMNSGFEIANENETFKRKSICKECEHWISSAWNGTGKCKKCGCSTWAKIRLATERCPIGKWEASEKTLE